MEKKQAVAVQREFFEELPTLRAVDATEAEIAWLIYDLIYEASVDRYKLVRAETKYTKFKDALDTITTAEPGNMDDFISYLSDRIKKGKIMGTPLESELPPVIEPLPAMFEEPANISDSEYTGEDDNGIVDEAV
jgi:hypothetical protein